MENYKEITEDYVSFEVAKLLKEKGFGVPCRQAYFNGSLVDYTMYGFCDGELLDCPSQSLALKWLREVHKLHITIKPYITEEGIMYLFEIYKLEAEKFTLIKTKTGFEKSELANEAALKYALENLI